MGVPKFYRWISEKYPHINQCISDGTLLPEFDNLYLDMNGIIHGCTHPADADVTKAISMREMMLGMFQYIERLVTDIVKPKKVLFMAIDGCAPRAKMNQQRSRRFRAAQERIEILSKLREKEEGFDEDSMFDSNCITPGTEFMDVVGAHIRWFIRKKIKEDPVWRDLTIIFSGHDVPGEGEHKIMQYIREERLKSSWSPNIRHCMVGQDADLIMLALATHEPHFTLLREVIDFNSFNRHRNGVRQTIMRQSKDAQFQLMHISVLREYLELDLCLPLVRCEDELSEDVEIVPAKSYNRERLIDDFILLTFLVGNDFLPHLPTLDIGEHGFDIIFDAYKLSMHKFGGEYLVDNGDIVNLSQLEYLFALIGQQEASILSHRDEEVKEFIKRKSNRRSKMKIAEQAGLSWEETEEAELAAQKVYEEALKAAGDVAFVAPSTAVENSDSDSSNEEDVDTDLMDAEVDDNGLMNFVDDFMPPKPVKDYRGRYYFEKFKLLPSEVKKSEFMDKLRDSYLEGLMWCIAYYTKGCVSWTWYFPYHYGPMLIDMTDLVECHNRISFDLGQPFRPFQQLLGCLPPGSKSLLPKKYQWLMSNEMSPVLEFYPLDFEIDQNGKKNPWEAVVLLPFIDEARVIEAEKKYCGEHNLTLDEKKRNNFGNVLTYKYNPSMTSTYYSCNPEIGLEDVHSCQSECMESYPSLAPCKAFVPELYPGTICPYPGFPSLTVLPVASSHAAFAKINVFGNPTKYKSVIIDIDSSASYIEGINIPGSVGNQLVEDKVISLITKSVFVNYPLLTEGKVVAISTELAEYRAVSSIEGDIQQIITSLQKTVKENQKAYDHRYFSRDVHGEDRPPLDLTVKLLKNGTILKIPHDDDSRGKWLNGCEEEREKYLLGKGLPGTGGLSIGEIQMKFTINALQGMERNPTTGATRKVFGTDEVDVPFQMVLLHSDFEDIRFKETPEIPINKLFPVGSDVIVTSGSSKYLGQKAKVMGFTHGKRQVDLEFSDLSPEPPFANALANAIRDEFYSTNDICDLLDISPSLLGRLVGSILVHFNDPIHGATKVDIGLDLKRNGCYQLLGYAKLSERQVNTKNDTVSESVWKNANAVKILNASSTASVMSKKHVEEVSDSTSYWEYTLRTVALLSDYKANFPDLFSNLATLGYEKCYHASQLFKPLGPNANGGSLSANVTTYKRLEEAISWLNCQPYRKLPRTPFSTEALSREAIKAIERAADVRTSMLAASQSSRTQEVKIVRSVPIDIIFRGDTVRPTDAPLQYNKDVVPGLGDRIVNLSAIGVPCGIKGTVIVTHRHTGYVEVLFDEEFVSGQRLNGFCSSFRGKLVPWSSVLKIPQQHVETPSSSGTKNSNVTATAANHKIHHVTENKSKSKPVAETTSKAKTIMKREDKTKVLHSQKVPNKEEELKPNSSKKSKMDALSLLKSQMAMAKSHTMPPPPPSVEQSADTIATLPVPPVVSAVPTPSACVNQSAGRNALAAAAMGQVVEAQSDTPSVVEDEVPATTGRVVNLGTGIDLNNLNAALPPVTPHTIEYAAGTKAESRSVIKSRSLGHEPSKNSNKAKQLLNMMKSTKTTAEATNNTAVKALKVKIVKKDGDKDAKRDTNASSDASKSVDNKKDSNMIPAAVLLKKK